MEKTPKDKAMAAWKRRVMKNAGESTWLEALAEIMDPNFIGVSIYHNNETGIWQWSIVVCGTAFWLDSFATESKARELCDAMGWGVLSTRDDQKGTLQIHDVFYKINPR